MAGPNLTYHPAIQAVETKSGNTDGTVSVAEKAGQTFKIGVPVQLSAGYIQQWDGTTIAAGIAGVSLIPGSNLASNGKGAPTNFGPVGPPATIQTYGNVPFQASAVNIAIGAPITDGRTLFNSPRQDTIFEAVFDNSAGNVAADYTITQAQIGTDFGLTIDANGQFYVDNNKTTDGTNTVVQVIGVNPLDLSATAPNTYIVNARVRFVFLSAAIQLLN